MGDPHGIAVEVLDGDDAVVADARLGEGAVYHQIAFAGGERVGRMVGVLGASYPDDEMVRLGCAFGEDLHVPQMERLESSYDKGIARVLVLHRDCDCGPRLKGFGRGGCPS